MSSIIEVMVYWYGLVRMKITEWDILMNDDSQCISLQNEIAETERPNLTAPETSTRAALASAYKGSTHLAWSNQALIILSHDDLESQLQ